MPLELFSDCFQNVNFPVFLLKTTIPSETEEGPNIFKLHEAAMFVYSLHTDAFARGSAILTWVIFPGVSCYPFSARSKNPFEPPYKYSDFESFGPQFSKVSYSSRS